MARSYFKAFAAVLSIAMFTSAHAQDPGPLAATPDSTQLVSCNEQLRSDNFSLAVNAANVALSQSAVTADPERRFSTLVCRARAFEGLANSDAAEKDYREALRLAERHFEPFDTRLIQPLSNLGRLRFRQEDVDQAELLLLRARDLTHRSAGVYNVQQQEILDDLTAVYARQNRRQQANRLQELRLKSVRETYGEGPELVDALQDHARYNALAKRFSLVRQSLEEAVSILESEYGPNDPNLIETLKLRAQLYKLHPTISTPKAGEQAMQRVVDILDQQEFVDEVDLLNARTDMGDWYLQGFKFHKALRYYKKTVRKSLDEGIDPALVDSVYGAPKLIFFERTKVGVFGRDESGEPIQSGTIKVRYNVSAKGRTQNIRFIEDTVKVPAMVLEIRERVENAVFRPRFVNGKAAVTRDVEQAFDIVQSGTGGLSIGKIHSPVLTDQ